MTHLPPEAPPPTHDDQLAAVQKFMDVTSEAIGVQSLLLRELGGLVGGADRERYAGIITAEAAANVQAIKVHLSELATTGLRFAIREGPDLFPLKSIGLDPNSGRYLVRMGRREEQRYLPLGMDRQLVIDRPAMPYVPRSRPPADRTAPGAVRNGIIPART